MKTDRLCAPVDAVEGLAEVVGERVGGGDDVWAGANRGLTLKRQRHAGHI